MRVVGAILQGGRSTRMGRDKAGVDVGGVPMRARVHQALSAVCDEVVQVGGPGADVKDPQDADGPLHGVSALLQSGRAGDGGRYVVVAVDQPLLSPTVLARLLAVDPGPDGGVCFAGEPLPVVLAAGACDRVQRMLVRGIRRMEELATVTLPLDEEARVAVTNVNTPADLAHLPRFGAGDPETR